MSSHTLEVTGDPIQPRRFGLTGAASEWRISRKEPILLYRSRKAAPLVRARFLLAAGGPGDHAPVTGAPVMAAEVKQLWGRYGPAS